MNKPDSREVAKLDLKKYQTGELVEQLTELISIPGAILQILFTAIYTTFVVLLIVAAMAFFSEFSGLSWMIVCSYSLFAGALLGVVLGILRVIYRGLGNLEGILQLILGVARHAAVDSKEIQSGAMRGPSGAELVEQVYEDVLQPTLEKVVEGVFGWFGTPILWVYRRTIGSSVRFLIRRVPTPKLSEENDAAIQSGLESGIVGTAGYSDQIQRYTQQASDVVGSIGGGIRFYVMRPLFFLFCGAILIAALPILIYRFWAGWVTTPETEKMIDDLVFESVSMLFQLPMH